VLGSTPSLTSYGWLLLLIHIVMPEIKFIRILLCVKHQMFE
jgi:hypothetical protein